MGASAALLGLWAALSLLAPRLAGPLSDTVHLVRERAGLNTVRPRVEP